MGNILPGSGSAERPMTARERLTLSTWEKWRRFGRIPWKFILTVALVCCCTAQVVLYQEYTIPYERNNIMAWETLLAPSGLAAGASETYGIESVYFIYQISALVASLNQTRNLYFGIHQETVDNYEYLNDTGSEEIPPMTLSVTSYDDAMDIFDITRGFSDTTHTNVTYLYADSGLGPFDANDTSQFQQYVHTIREMSLSFAVMNYRLSGRRTCFIWNVVTNYDFRIRGRMVMSIDTSFDFCPSEQSVSWYNRDSVGFLVLMLFIAMLSFLLLLLILRAIWRSISIYHQVKNRMAAFQGDALKSFQSLSWKDKMRFFNLWFFFSLVGNVSNITAAILAIQSMVQVRTPPDWYIYLMGLGTLMTWVTILQFFETSTSYYVLITTLTKGAPRVARFLVGVMPVFLGYAMFAVSYFGTASERFSSIDQACVTQFSLLNGDVVHDVFDELYPAHPYISRIYLYTFISLFIYSVLNIFIAIIEDAFFASKAFQMQQEREAASLDLEKMDPLLLVDRIWAPRASDAPSEDSVAAAVQAANRGEGARGAAYAARHDTLREARVSMDSGMGLGDKSQSRQSLAASTGAAASAGVAASALGAGAGSASVAGERGRGSGDVTAYMVRQQSELAKMAVSDPAVQVVMDSLMEINLSFTYEIQKTFVDQLVAASGADGHDGRGAENPLGLVIRPPHAVEYFPCGYTDCLYCSVRSVFVEALDHARIGLAELFARPSGAGGGSASDQTPK